MTWLSGLWGWGEADAGEWQALYRLEGARRAMRAQVPRMEEVRRRRFELEQEQQDADRRRVADARLAAAYEVAGGRRRWVYLEHRKGRSYREIGVDMGRSAARAWQLAHSEMRRAQ